MPCYAGGELQGSPVWQALAGHKRRIPLAVVLPRPARGVPAMQEIQFNSWVRKILWRRDRIPTPVFLGFPSGSAGKEFT